MSNRKKILDVQKVHKKCMIVMLICLIAVMAIILFRYFAIQGKYNERQQLISSGHDMNSPDVISIDRRITEGNRHSTYTVLVLLIIILIDGIVAYATSRYSLYLDKKEVYKLAYEDEVTGMPTKAKHRDDIEEFFQHNTGSYAYVSLEIDNFTVINELYGYLFGNKTLKYVADGIREMLYPEELYARTGGAHFGFLLRYDNDEALEKRLRYWFAKLGQMQIGDHTNSFTLQFTCGVYRVGNEIEDASRARKCANIARESAPHLCDNSIAFYNDELKRKQNLKTEIELEMHSAFEQKQFQVYLQPKYKTQDEKIIGAEALIRWIHPEKGFIYPNDFIPVFEANGFIVRIDFFVLEEVCKCIKAWIDDGIEPVVISVNLSRVHLYDPDLVDNIIKLVDSYNVPRKYVEFELTETVLFEESDMLLETMKKLKKAGFILSMDDFGSGYSSLNLLKRMPVDVLKLDKAFMDNLEKADADNRDRSIITHVISMAKDLNMEVLAEGVENESQQRFLKESDCDMIQGYYYSKPIAIGEFDQKFRNVKL